MTTDCSLLMTVRVSVLSIIYIHFHSYYPHSESFCSAT